MSHATNQDPSRFSSNCGLRIAFAAALLLAVVCGGAGALAQSEGGSIGGDIGGSTGGSIGGSVGDSKPAPVAPPAVAPVAPKPAAVPQTQRATRVEPPRRERVERVERPESHASNAFDGIWSINVESACAGSGAGSLRIRGGQVYGSNVRGTISPSGSLYATGRSAGMTQHSTGRLSGSSGGGSFRRADGCTGTWTASR